MLFEMLSCKTCNTIYKSRNFIMLFEVGGGVVDRLSTKVEILLCYLSSMFIKKSQNLQK